MGEELSTVTSLSPQHRHVPNGCGDRATPRSPVLRIVAAMAAIVAVVAAAITINGSRNAPKQARIIPIQHASRLLRVLLVGDSMAGTLGVGLAKSAPSSGVTLIDAARGGCAVAIAWDGGWASSFINPVPPIYPCQNAQQLTTAWQKLLRQYQPDVVVYVNRMDTISQEVVPGSTQRMTSVLDPGFQTYLTNAMTQAVAVLASTGAHVILTTSAPTKIGLQGNRYDDPKRWAVYDSILRTVADRSGGRASIFDLGRFFGGDGSVPVFQLDSPSGIQWRCRDGLHFTEAGGVLVAPALFAMAWSLGAQVSPSAQSRPPVPATVANQPWAPYAAEKVVMGCGS